MMNMNVENENKNMMAVLSQTFSISTLTHGEKNG